MCACSSPKDIERRAVWCARDDDDAHSRARRSSINETRVQSRRMSNKYVSLSLSLFAGWFASPISLLLLRASSSRHLCHSTPPRRRYSLSLLCVCVCASAQLFPCHRLSLMMRAQLDKYMRIASPQGLIRYVYMHVIRPPSNEMTSLTSWRVKSPRRRRIATRRPFEAIYYTRAKNDSLYSHFFFFLLQTRYWKRWRKGCARDLVDICCWLLLLFFSIHQLFFLFYSLCVRLQAAYTIYKSTADLFILISSTEWFFCARRKN